ncbi:YwaF family protein [Streptococcus himalayensis]|uniref:Membrane protein n=1 Tax=Streptococcus himalayensis TaxID=1888195 RepID=A0A917EG67_9STRE|nr:YwaF family protein [Streptococcus himalayensis]GGE29954.1 membrane protein [Streptococcus himalayensis]
MIEEFFTAVQTEPPQLTLVDHACLALLLVGVIYGVMKAYQKQSCLFAFKGLQVIQLLTLYGWYIWTRTPISESLPLYHCRMAMFALLLMPDEWLYKEYFAGIGVFGSIVALLYPVFDPFPWFHVTIFSFICGHVALLGSSLIYLQRRKALHLTKRHIVEITVILNLGILLVDILTGGDYGFLRQPPLVGNHGLFLNYLIMTLVFIVALCSVFKGLKFWRTLEEQRWSERVDEELG